MSAKFLFFAQCADWMGRKDMEISCPNPIKIKELLKKTEILSPLVNKKDFLKVAVNQTMADLEKEVCDGDEVAFMPPFSGG
jgi:molybdopterin converting factor small subunit